MNFRSLTAAALVVVALAPAVARADTADANRATARELTLEGYDALDRKDFATAADRFKRANALFPAPTIELGLAHAQVGLGKLVEALVTYSRITHEVLPPNAPPAFAKAVDVARAEMAALMPRISHVVIVVRGARGAKVTMDGVEVPVAALGVRRAADPGAHVISASAPGALPAEAKITLPEGKVENVELTLKLDPRAAPSPTPLAPPMVAPVEPPPPAPAGMSTQKLLGFVSIGAGAASLAVGAITGGLALSKRSALLEQCPDGQCFASQEAALKSDVDAYHALGAASTGTFIAGGALAATGVVLLLTAPRSKATREASLRPLLSPGFVGVSGRF
jgi:hypothetical protein